MAEDKTSGRRTFLKAVGVVGAGAAGALAERTIKHPKESKEKGRYLKLPAISGNVFKDVGRPESSNAPHSWEGDAPYGKGEPSAVGVTVVLSKLNNPNQPYGPTTVSARTDTNEYGEYVFEGIGDGTYIIGLDNVEGNISPQGNRLITIDEKSGLRSGAFFGLSSKSQAETPPPSAPNPPPTSPSTEGQQRA